MVYTRVGEFHGWPVVSASSERQSEGNNCAEENTPALNYLISLLVGELIGVTLFYVSRFHRASDKPFSDIGVSRVSWQYTFRYVFLPNARRFELRTRLPSPSNVITVCVACVDIKVIKLTCNPRE
jgi:hypothetical protein